MTHRITIFKTQFLNERIGEAVDLIIANLDPLKIYLFGGYSRGKYDTELSEVDILIILDHSDKRFIDRIINVRSLCAGDPPINPLIYTTNEITKMLNEGEGFIEDILEEGVILYSKDETENI